MASTSVLVVDSDAERARAICERLRSDQWQTATAPDEATARKLLSERAVAVALIDTTMWRAGSLVDFMKTEHATTPVIILTGSGPESAGLIEQLRLGATSFVPRHASARRLHEAVGTIVELTNRSPHRERVRPFLCSGQIELKLDNDLATIPLVVVYIQQLLEDYGLFERPRAGPHLRGAARSAHERRHPRQS